LEIESLNFALNKNGKIEHHIRINTHKYFVERLINIFMELDLVSHGYFSIMR